MIKLLIKLTNFDLYFINFALIEIKEFYAKVFLDTFIYLFFYLILLDKLHDIVICIIFSPTKTRQVMQTVKRKK